MAEISLLDRKQGVFLRRREAVVFRGFKGLFYHRKWKL
jgi:hypothetical protein